MKRLDRPRVLFVDAYDSFSNNIISLLETDLNIEIAVIKIDAQIENLSAYLKAFVAVVAGPGPGDPRTPDDVGLFQRLWDLKEADAIPVLGICLGFQSLVLAHGGRIELMPEPRHGVVRRVTASEQSIFRGIPSLETVQYHSLHAILPFSEDPRSMNQKSERLTLARNEPVLMPLAWDYANAQEQVGAQNPSAILMAVKHMKKPLYGIQFHPESISSSPEARQVVSNWWEEIFFWRAGLSMTLNTKFHGFERHCYNGGKRTSWRPETDINDILHDLEPQTKVTFEMISLADLTVPQICDIINASSRKVIVFDSENHQNSDTGAFSVIGVVEDDSTRIEHSRGSNEVFQVRNGEISISNLSRYNGNLFHFLEEFMQMHKARHSQHNVPFWGGLMGYITYEACLETLRAQGPVKSNVPQSRPDIGFVFIERSIVIDHFNHIVHVQSIKPNDHSWVLDTSSLLSFPAPTTDHASLPQHVDATITLPDEKQYKEKIGVCQASIQAGNSYELCLTSQAIVTTPSRLSSWPMYRRLRNINPAPFGAYLRFGDLTVLSSSPERFMRWSRPSIAKPTYPNMALCSGPTSSTLQFRPIKGTIPRRSTPHSPPRSLTEATKLLSTQKERAENLMIADLIRHDLHGIVGPGRVTVPKLMVVEEYETVFQLVTVIEGTMIMNDSKESPQGERKEDHACERWVEGTETNLTHKSSPKASSPLSALPATLPPGSMTGAPKLRSCQILQSLEGRPRGVYSGIIGYMDVGGGGDWSVAIRCAVRWDEPSNALGDHWTVGAGGAVTALSTEQGEWEEMLAKLQATLRVFEE